MADYTEFADPTACAVGGRSSTAMLVFSVTPLREATEHAVVMRDAIASGDDRVHPGDRALILVDVLNQASEAAALAMIGG